MFLRGYVNRALQRRKNREALYDTADPTSAAFLATDPHNFQIDRQHVIQITVNRKRSLWTPYNVGTVTITFSNGSDRRFILIGDQDADVIAETLKRFFPETATVGVSSPRPQNSEPRIQGWIPLALLSVFFFAFAIFFVIVAFRPVGNLGFLVIGGLNLWAAIHCLRLAQKRRASPAEEKQNSGTLSD